MEQTHRIKGNEVNGYVIQRHLGNDVWLDLTDRFTTYDEAVNQFYEVVQSDEA